MNYSEKLKDPRWQKLRLKVFERDNWLCQRCGETEKTLMIHHLYYEHGLEPWDYLPEHLITLCFECHTYEHEHREEEEKFLLQILKQVGISSEDLSVLSAGFTSLIIRSNNDSHNIPPTEHQIYYLSEIIQDLANGDIELRNYLNNKYAERITSKIENKCLKKWGWDKDGN
jgi:hypothetical protein